MSQINPPNTYWVPTKYQGQLSIAENLKLKDMGPGLKELAQPKF